MPRYVCAEHSMRYVHLYMIVMDRCLRVMHRESCNFCSATQRTVGLFAGQTSQFYCIFLCVYLFTNQIRYLHKALRHIRTEHRAHSLGAYQHHSKTSFPFYPLIVASARLHQNTEKKRYRSLLRRRRARCWSGSGVIVVPTPNTHTRAVPQRVRVDRAVAKSPRAHHQTVLDDPSTLLLCFHPSSNRLAADMEMQHHWYVQYSTVCLPE